MGRYIKITCDVCGKDIYGQEYYTIAPRRIMNGKQTKIPTIWVCHGCMLKTHLMFAFAEGEKTND